MTVYRSFKYYLSMMLLTASLAACTNQQNPENETDKTAFEERNDYPQNQLQQDNAQVDKNSGAYTYIIEPEDVVVPVVEPDAEKPRAQQTSQKNPDVPQKVDRKKMDKLDPNAGSVPQIHLDTNALFKDMTINRPPIYTRTCLSDPYPVKCSMRKVENYVKKNLEYPDAAIEENQDGLMIVTFRVTKDGTVENVNVKAKERPCQGCPEAAIRVVEKMPEKWAPALHNSETKNALVTLPVRFETR